MHHFPASPSIIETNIFMEKQTLEIPVLQKSKESKRPVTKAESSCCATPSTGTACCTPSKSEEENGGACCAQPQDGSSCCDK